MNEKKNVFFTQYPENMEVKIFQNGSSSNSKMHVVLYFTNLDLNKY